MSSTPSLALLIGIRRYQQLSDLPGVATDLKGISRCLIAHGVTCAVVDDDHDHVSLKRARSSIAEFVIASQELARSESSPLVFFVFAGHGMQCGLQEFPHLIPWDGDPLDEITLLNLQKEVVEPLNHIQAKVGREFSRLRVVMLLDCCRYNASDTTWRGGIIYLEAGEVEK